MNRALKTFLPFHAFVNSPRLQDYKQIAHNLEKDFMSAAVEGAAQKNPPSGDGAAKLEDELPPAGQRFFVGISDGKSSYRHLAVQSVAGLEPDMQRPFLAPFDELRRFGLRDVNDTVKRVWTGQMKPPVRELLAKAPFSQTAEQWATPEEVAGLLHPKDGQFTRLYRNFVEPLSKVGDDDPFAPSRDFAGLLGADMFDTSKGVQFMASRLWDDAGNPKKIEIEIRTVPFESKRGAKVPTVVILDAGGTSIQNYNQKPFTTKLAIDWTKTEPAQIRVGLVDLTTQETSVVALGDSEPFAFFRLLRRASSQGIRDAMRYEWRVPIGGDALATVQFDVIESPWKAFRVPHSVSSSRGKK